MKDDALYYMSEYTYTEQRTIAKHQTRNLAIASPIRYHNKNVAATLYPNM